MLCKDSLFGLFRLVCWQQATSWFVCDVFKAVSIFGSFVNKLGDTKICLGKLNCVDSLMQETPYPLFTIDKIAPSQWFTLCPVVVF